MQQQEYISEYFYNGKKYKEYITVTIPIMVHYVIFVKLKSIKYNILLRTLICNKSKR